MIWKWKHRFDNQLEATDIAIFDPTKCHGNRPAQTETGEKKIEINENSRKKIFEKRRKIVRPHIPILDWWNIQKDILSSTVSYISAILVNNRFFRWGSS